jgi:hypothetical protein
MLAGNVWPLALLLTAFAVRAVLQRKAKRDAARQAAEFRFDPTAPQPRCLQSLSPTAIIMLVSHSPPGACQASSVVGAKPGRTP